MRNASKANQQLERWISFEMMLIVLNALLQLALVMLNDDAPDDLRQSARFGVQTACAPKGPHTFASTKREEHRRQGSAATSLSFEDSLAFHENY